MIATLSLVGAIFFGVLGVLATLSASIGDKNSGRLSWAAWILFYPAFVLLFFAFELYGVAGGFALWGAALSLIVTIQGLRWGDNPTTAQWLSIALVILGLTAFGLSGG